MEVSVTASNHVKKNRDMSWAPPGFHSDNFWKMILAGLSSITEELSGNFLYNSLLGDHNITTELLHRLMEQTIEPAVRGYLKRPEETGSIDTDE